MKKGGVNIPKVNYIQGSLLCYKSK
jgi:hypothetical protein